MTRKNMTDWSSSGLYDDYCNLLIQDGLAPLSTDLSKNLFQYINHIPAHHSNPKHKHGVTPQQFQVFAAHALKGTFEEKATIFCGMKNSRNITMKDVSEVP